MTKNVDFIAFFAQFYIKNFNNKLTKIIKFCNIYTNDDLQGNSFINFTIFNMIHIYFLINMNHFILNEIYLTKSIVNKKSL